MKVLITGSAGFIGKNLASVLKHQKDVKLYYFDVNQTEDELDMALKEADFIYHLAGVNRPVNDNEFNKVNMGLTATICNRLIEIKREPSIVFSSSTQAELDNSYGVSKRRSEEVLVQYQKDSGANVVIYRLPGVFGKWSRPNYNSVVATFCYNIARDLPIEIIDENRELKLVYIDDVIQAFLKELQLVRSKTDINYAEVLPVYSIKLGKLAEMIRSFRQSRNNLILPNMDNNFSARLYATYLSFLKPDDFSYHLPVKEDQRGAIAEFIKSPSFGQIFLSRTKPGITRGNHYHHTKVEKFLVLEGKGIIRFRNINSNEILTYQVGGKDFTVVDIPPGYTHSIENKGTTEMVVLFWAGEIFDPGNPDTEYFEVLK